MARVTHVKKAQQRYYTVPVIDPETGEQKKTPVMNKRTGQQKTDKRGNPVFLRLTKEDRTKPKPNLKCDYPSCEFPDKEIKPGQAYKHITPKSGPYGGVQKNRHEEHPTWNVWEYSSSLSARVAEVQHDAAGVIEGYTLESEEDFDSLKEEVADLARALYDEKQEALDNMPEALQDSSQLAEQVTALEEWVDEIEGVDPPDEFPEAEDTVERWHAVGPDAQDLNEEGFDDEVEAQQELDNYLAEHPDEDPDEWDVEAQEHAAEDPEPDPEEVEAWADSAKQALQDALDNCQV